MDEYDEAQFSGKVLDHLGLVADTIEQLDLVNLLDSRLPIAKNSGTKVSMGERVSAMILNGLGFIDTRLYLFPEFLCNKPVERLFGRVIQASYFNDDALGRCLDSISAYGVTKLFSEIAFTIGQQQKLLGRSSNIDTSTLQLWGEYSSTDTDGSLSDDAREKETGGVALPKHGYSKSHRHDLKQMVITLATTGQAGFPIWMEAHSGNASDQVVLPNAAARMKNFCAQLTDAPDFLYIGDSALYANVIQFSDQLKWLSRVPETLLAAKQLIRKPFDEIKWNALPDGYAYYAIQQEHGGVKQRWVLMYSEQAYYREVKTLLRNVKKSGEALDKEWWHLSNETFVSEVDATLALKKLKKKMKYHQVHARIIALDGYAKQGRPRTGAQPVVKGYQIQYTLTEDDAAITEAKNKKGRFILASNEMREECLPTADFLSEYKSQAKTESGFKFIKDNAFQVDSIFLKTPHRISALMMIMTLCLMVYGVSAHNLSASLQAAGETLPSQTRKPTNKPSLKWIYRLFSGVHELTINNASAQVLVINVSPLLKQIVSHFGPRAKTIYLNSS